MCLYRLACGIPDRPFGHSRNHGRTGNARMRTTQGPPGAAGSLAEEWPSAGSQPRIPFRTVSLDHFSIESVWMEPKPNRFDFAAVALHTGLLKQDNVSCVCASCSKRSGMLGAVCVEQPVSFNVIRTWMRSYPVDWSNKISNAGGAAKRCLPENRLINMFQTGT